MTSLPDNRPQKFTRPQATGYYLHNSMVGLDPDTLVRYYCDLRDSVFGGYADSNCMWRLKDDVGISRRPTEQYSWEIFQLEAGIVMVELKGNLGPRDNHGRFFTDEELTRSRGLGLTVLTFKLMPPDSGLEKGIEDLMSAKYGTSYMLMPEP